MNSVTENELLMLLGQKEVELYALRRNEAALVAKLNELEALAETDNEKVGGTD